MTTSRSLDIQGNLWLVLKLIGVIIAVAWLSFNFEAAGTLYFNLFGLTTFVIFIVFLITRESDPKFGFREIWDNTINVSNTRAVSLYFVGLAIPFLLILIGSVVGLTIYNPNAVQSLLKVEDAVGAESFQALQIQTNPTFAPFIVITGAGTAEEFMARLGAPVLAIVLLNIVGLAFGFNIMAGTFVWKLGIAFISSSAFMGLHLLNGTYVNNPNLFIIAFIFSFIMSIFVLFFKAGLMFTIGVHEANNLIALNGLSGVGQTITSYVQTPAGLGLFILFYVLPFFYLIRNLNVAGGHIRKFFAFGIGGK